MSTITLSPLPNAAQPRPADSTEVIRKELAERIGITEANLSLLKSSKVKGVRFETLDKICAVLECQPGDLLEYK